MARDKQGGPANEKKLEQYGVWVKVKPREVITTPALEDSFQLSDLDASKVGTVMVPPEEDESTLTVEEEKLLDELETELVPEDTSENVFVPEEEPLLAEGELPDIESEPAELETPDIALGQSSDEELPELEEESEPAPRAESPRHAAPEPGEVEVTLSDDLEEKEHFDDLEAVESELASVATTTRQEAAHSSADILARIESELRTIRTDLTQLRTELSGLRESAAAQESGPEASDAEASGGFFDEDEDETIALTGDELDNILNTADITEEPAEAPSTEIPAEGDLDIEVFETPSEAESKDSENEEAAPADLQDDILSYETVTMEEDKLPPLPEDSEETVDLDASEDSLVLLDESPIAEEEQPEIIEASLTEDIPAELVLDELAVEPETEASEENLESVELPEIDLEAIPEIEAELEPIPVTPGPAESSSLDDEGSETIDLETLDLGEEPTIVEAVPEQVEEIEVVPDAESLDEAETVLEEEPTDDAALESIDTLTDEVDLEALAAEAEELEDNVPAAPSVDDLDLGDLESVNEEEAPAAEAPVAEAAPEEIEIAFEEGSDKELEKAEELESLESLEQVLDAEEVLDEATAESEATPAAAANADIPDNLKDEIRTVLKYMDHLLEALPDEKIQEFASSDYFVMYKKLFEDLGLGE